MSARVECPAVWCEGCQTLASELCATDVPGVELCPRCAPYPAVVLRLSAAARVAQRAARSPSTARTRKRRGR